MKMAGRGISVGHTQRVCTEAWKVSRHPHRTPVWETTSGRVKEKKELEGKMFVQCFIPHRDKQNTHGLVLPVMLILLTAKWRCIREAVNHTIKGDSLESFHLALCETINTVKIKMSTVLWDSSCFL